VRPERSLLDRLIQLGRPSVVTGFAPPPRPVAAGLWSLERRLRMPGGPGLPAHTTLIRLPSGGLLVVSPPPVEAGGLETLEALGPVEEVLAPNSFHYLTVRDFLVRHPRATLRLAPGLPRRVPDLPPGAELHGPKPASWRGVLEHVVLGPVGGISEVALFHVPSATLLLTDVAFHGVRSESRLERALWRLGGIPAGFGPSRSARWLLLRDRHAAAAFLERVLAWPFRRVLVAHGDPLETDAHAVFRRAFAAYLAGPHVRRDAASTASARSDAPAERG
jgi:hypothetical protein